MANQIKKEDRLNFVKSKLGEINKRLPAAVYIPFTNSKKKKVLIISLMNLFIGSIRNLSILKIEIDETFLFSSKDRAPVLIYFQGFRIEE